jgi:integrase
MKPKIVVRKSHSKTHPFVVDLRAFNKGRKFFKIKAEAEAEAYRQRTLLERHTREAVGLSQRELSELVHARTKLAEYGETVTEAVRHRVDYLERIRRCKVTVSQLAGEVIEAKRRDGMSASYLTDLRCRLRRFCHDFGTRLISGITVEELDNWLRDLEGSPKSRANSRTNVSVMFGYAVKRRMLDFNPVLNTSKPKLIDKAPEIFAVDDLRSLLEAATRTARDIIPMLAIGAFAGLREAEILRLDWSEIDLVRGHIEVKAAKAKTARRRIVPIQPNLSAWLRPYAGKTGRVVPPGSREKLVRARKEAGLLKWPNNGLRHSFASYRLAAIHDAPRVSMELGHTSPALLFNTYREVVHEAEAERYWKIVPAVEAEKIVAFAGPDGLKGRP